MAEHEKKGIKEIENAAGALLSRCRDASIRVRLLRGVYRLPDDDPLLADAEAGSTQLPEPDGSVGLWERWYGVLQAAFFSGKYNADDERRAIIERFGLDDEAGLTCLNTKRALGILASRDASIPRMLEELLLNHVWRSDACMGIPGLKLSAPPTPGLAEEWLGALELLSNFRLGMIFAEPQVFMLWEARGADGLWDDFHHPPGQAPRDAENRRIAMTARILIYLRKNWGC